jgi:hypothetical protein
MNERKNTEEEKGKEKTEPKMNKAELRKKQNQQIFWALFLMIGMILIIVGVPFIIKNYINKFEYSNLDFYKGKNGDILLYYANIPVTNSQGVVSGHYTVNFREDPRELAKEVNVTVEGDVIKFVRGMQTYITIGEIPICENNAVASVRLASFLSGFAGLNIKGAVTNKTKAEETGQKYVTCETNPTESVIVIEPGNKTEIVQRGDNCYYIHYTDCDINKATERFTLFIIEKYMEFFDRR